MIFENDKSYRLEILVVYAQNKFVYAHGFNFFSTGITFLKFFKNQFACSKFYAKFLISRVCDKKNETSDMHDNLIDYTQDILIHIYIYMISNLCQIVQFFRIFFLTK